MMNGNETIEMEMLLKELERQKRISTDLYNECERLRLRKELFINIGKKDAVTETVTSILDHSQVYLEELFKLEQAVRKYLGIENKKYGAMDLRNRTIVVKKQELCQALVLLYNNLGWDDE